MKSILTLIGTRPEAIKLSPFLIALAQNAHFKSTVCASGQHTDLLEPFFIELGISIDYQFENHEPNHPLELNVARMLEKCGDLVRALNPDVIVVQGDTTTAFVGALSAFYNRIPIAHLEAGLRSDDINKPWPEEGHRCFIDRMTSYFFAPTPQARQNLLREGISPEKIWVVGNTSIDAIRLRHLMLPSSTHSKEPFILVTVHRRENHGKPLQEICQAIRTIAVEFPKLHIVVLLHPNPASRKTILEQLSGITNIHLREPVGHASFIKYLAECLFVVTDSGGIQEEAPFIGKPVLILRDTTERPEGIQAGTARLVGTQANNIIQGCQLLLNNTQLLSAMSKKHYPYGDGYAAERIVNILEEKLKNDAL